MDSQEFGDFIRRTIACLDLDHFRRRTEIKAALREIGILGHDGRPLTNGEIPDGLVIGRLQTGVFDVNRVRE